MRRALVPAMSLACLSVLVAGVAPARAQSPPAVPGASAGSRALPFAPRPALPVAATLPVGGAAPAGFSAALVTTLDGIMADAIADGATPGAALVVGHGGRIVLERSWGRVDWDPTSPAVDEHTVYDLASLTKVAGTTVAAMILASEGRLDLDRPVADYLDGWPAEGDRGLVTPRLLLRHRSGLPAFAALYRKATSPEEALAAMADVALVSTPGTRETYSDLDMILLGLVVEHVAGEPLDAFLERRVYRPLGMARTAFRPLEAGIAPSDIAPTEVIRRAQLHGVVHDPNARGLGGVVGNAGLFASARDLGVLASALLWEAPERLVCRDVVRAFTHGERSGHYALGWEMATRDSSWGDYFSDEAFGHTGYTGTSLWIDPELDVFVVLLTNRVDPTAANEKHLALRRNVHEAIRRSLLDPWGDGIVTGWFDAPRRVDDAGVRDEHGWRSVDGCRADVARDVLSRMGSRWPRVW